MNQVKKTLGAVWMLLSPTLVLFMVWQASEKIGAASAATKANTTLQWGIILTIFLPICVGFFLFGRYAWQNEYAHLPENSEELSDQ
jgi:hypothetical protein